LNNKLKEELFKLLEKDIEFRYAVMGLLGIREIIESINRNTEAIRSLQEQVMKLQDQVLEQSNKGPTRAG